MCGLIASELIFPGNGHPLNRMFSFGRSRPGRAGLEVDQGDRAPPPCISGPIPGRVMLLEPSLWIVGDPGIKGSVPARNDIDKPGGFRYGGFRIACANHCKCTFRVVKRPRSFRKKRIGEKGKLPTDNDDYMNKNNTAEHFDKQSLIEHLRDLRSCLIFSLIAVAAGFGVAYAYVEPIGVWFFKPLTDVLPKGASLIFTSYQEGFFFI